MALSSFADCRNSLLEGKTTCTEIVRQALDVIDEKNPSINAFTHVDADGVYQSAESLDQRIARGERLPLAGLVLGIKDVLSTSEWPVTCSSKILEGYRPPFEATSVARLRNAGALMVGRTNCDEFAMGSTTEHSAYGVTLNPHDQSFVAGGSSGGSAAAVAAGMCHAALGTDTGGSIRQPAAFCGVVGLKPTYGLVSRYGLVAFASSFDCVGPMAQNPRDARQILYYMMGNDPKDATSLDHSSLMTESQEDIPLDGLRVGLLSEYYGDGIQDEVTHYLDQTADHLQSHGAELKTIDMPHIAHGIAAYYILATAEASSNLSRYDGVKYGVRIQGDEHSLESMYTATRGYGFGFEVKRRIMLGTYVLSAGYYDAYYGKAQRVRSLIRNDFDEAWKKVDVMLTPVTPTAGARIGEWGNDPLQMYLSDAYTVTANLAGIPALSVPVGKAANGLPVGVQIIGPPLSESRLLSIGEKIMMLANTVSS
ncbi:MAG: Asp-tRNA(Asn)/Glu-tRNA(Gln) amidotransferase subunit GatA [Bacteroidetes bacterium]|nr:Asp-tRNA(Asn)/Glu-tRNA(Gln) amidotransferase subunit GatA [Bacteroidota bacterium]